MFISDDTIETERIVVRSRASFFSSIMLRSASINSFGAQSRSRNPLWYVVDKNIMNLFRQQQLRLWPQHYLLRLKKMLKWLKLLNIKDTLRICGLLKLRFDKSHNKCWGQLFSDYSVTYPVWSPFLSSLGCVLPSFLSALKIGFYRKKQFQFFFGLYRRVYVTGKKWIHKSDHLGWSEHKSTRWSSSTHLIYHQKSSI